MSTSAKSTEKNTCFGPSVKIYKLLCDKVVAHNEKYPRANIKTEQIRQLFASFMNKGLDLALAKVNSTFSYSANVHSGKGFKVSSVTPEDIQTAKNELKQLNLDQVKAEDLYFEADETHVPIWNQLI